MKTLAIFGIIFLGFNSIGQNTTANNQKVLYRGFENQVNLDQIISRNQNFKVETINCDATSLDQSKNEYMVRVHSNVRTAQLNFTSNGKVIDSMAFVVQNLPVPSLFWGDNDSGSYVSKSMELQMKYPVEVNFKATFTIISWECTMKDVIYRANGSSLSQEVLTATESLNSGEEVQIVANVISSDGIVRKISGTWLKE